MNLLRLRQIELRVVEPYDLEFISIFADECSAKPAVCTKNDDLHSGNLMYL